MFKNILFVCVGNICRSPMAEYWARAQLQKSGLTDIHISSAGINDAMQGSPAAKETQTILNRFGIDASAHVARYINKNIVQNADIIFVMETCQKKELSVVFPECHGKIFFLGQWTNSEIIDPYRKDQAAFETTFESIKKNWEIWQNKLWR